LRAQRAAPLREGNRQPTVRLTNPTVPVHGIFSIRPDSELADARRAPARAALDNADCDDLPLRICLEANLQVERLRKELAVSFRKDRNDDSAGRLRGELIARPGDGDDEVRRELIPADVSSSSCGSMAISAYSLSARSPDQLYSRPTAPMISFASAPPASPFVSTTTPRPPVT